MIMNKVLHGDSVYVLKTLPPNSIDFVFTSPSPFGHGKEGIGSEDDPEKYVINLVVLFQELYRVVKPTGCVWLEIGDYHDNEGKLLGIPEDFICLVDKWILRSKCYWVRTEKWDYQEDYNRFARDVEYLYFFTKSKDHYFNNPSRKVQSSVFYADYKQPKGNSFESGFPEKIIERCISLSCPPNGVVLDVLADSGTTGVVAKRMGRKFIMIDIDYEKTLAMRGRLGVQ